MDNIFLYLLKNKPGNNLHFKKKSYWVFPDGFVYKSEVYSPIMVLYYKDSPIGLINYTNFPLSKEININFVQGVKQEKNNFNYKNLEKPFYEIILNSFIKASLKTGKKIIYNPIALQNKYDKNYIKDKKKELNKNLIIIKRLEDKIKKEKNKEKIKNLILKRIEYKKKNIEIQKNILTNEKIIAITRKIRDRYFTKSGELNFNKDRIKKLLNNIKIKDNYLSFKKSHFFKFPFFSTFKKH